MSSADVIGGNDDIIMEILLHLPAKSLIKFKLVSRKWLNLISDPNFVLRHYRQSPKTVSAIILSCFMPLDFEAPQTYMYVSLDENQNQNSIQSRADFFSFDPSAPGSIMISQSCNGLLLCYSENYGLPTGTYYIFNPVTNKFSIIPEPICHGNSMINYFSLAYEPTISPFYQVVCLQFYNSSCESLVYSSETETWKDSKNQELEFFSADFHDGVYWNGGIHWLLTSDGTSFRFDIQQETILKVPMPRPPLAENWNPHNLRHFMECQGHLFLIDFDCPEYVIYEMENDRSKWLVKHRLDINLIVTAFPDRLDINLIRNRGNSCNSVLELEKLISPVSLVEVENEGPSLVMYIPGRFISYGFKDNTFKTIGEAKFYESRLGKWYHTFNYMETLSYV
ncbi:hypothetical protein CCACVL1_11947 [Corchorus capsularis]|uniref:F-box domain-containing protein n=1 Tax=Corchorus capsularis TaxID=210143 RepID=A0A1R3IIS0_COCAP|nr:hypothetical protein CCACVL1_11947 [Corchorus capsularis]